MQPKQINSTAGFTLVELLVSLSIVVIISSVIVTRYSSFNSAVLLKSQTFEVALAIRQAQLLAVSAQGNTSGEFRSSFGVFLSAEEPDNKEYVVYRDDSGDGRYTPSTDTVIEIGTLDNRFAIRGFVDADNGGSDVTSGDNVLSIVFTRPNFDADFYRANGSVLNETEVYIEITPDGDDGTNNSSLRTVTVSSAGQITVQ